MKKELNKKDLKTRELNTGLVWERIEETTTTKLDYLKDSIKRSDEPNRLIYGMIKSGQMNCEEYEDVMSDRFIDALTASKEVTELYYKVRDGEITQSEQVKELDRIRTLLEDLVQTLNK